MLYNTFLAATGGAGYSSCNKMITKSFYQETVLYSPTNWAKPNITCEANITGAANRTRRKANITEKHQAKGLVFSGKIG